MRATRTKLVPILAGLGLYIGCAQPADDADDQGVDTTHQVVMRDSIVTLAAHHDVMSQPLRLMPPAARQPRIEHEVKPLPRPGRPYELRGEEEEAEEVFVFDELDEPSILELAPTPLANFDGIGSGVAGFVVQSAPPDTNGDVGPNHYMEIVNSDIAVYNKSTGALLFGPVPTNTLWSGFGGLCQTDNDGDGTVSYDPIADRWVVAQFAVSGTSTAFLQCVAVSTSPDPTGSYFRYSFNYGNAFPDYPKMGVWPDGYYETFNFFNAAGTAFLGSRVCAYDRAKMILGLPATQVCFSPQDAGSVAAGLLPADLDGSRLPPAGSPNFVVGLGNNANQLAFYKFHVDFATPANSTLTGPVDLNVPAFTEGCGGGACIPQTGTTQRLDSLADRLMYRLVYRNLSDHDALVVTHTVSTSTSTTAPTAIRWYELRGMAATPSIFQSGTFVAPGTSTFAWMSSASIDSAGNIGLGYSVSSATTRPAIHFTGRVPSDAAGVMSQGDNNLLTSGGVQTGSNLSRWGDYASMSVDPTDDCTFFFTTEYIPTDGAFNWRTRVGSFKLPGCGGAVGNDFSISANPSSVSSVQGGAGVSTTIGTAVTSGSAQTVSLSISGLPAGATASFNPTSVTAGGSSTLTLTAGATTPAGTVNLTVTGTGTSATHTTSVTWTITQPGGNQLIVNGGFEGGTAPWTLSGNAIFSTGAFPHSGTGYTILGRLNNSTGAEFQAITIPAGTSPNLTFFLNVTSDETTTTTQFDRLFVEIRNTAGTLLATPATFSNLNKGTAGVYVQRGPFSLGAFAGQTIRVQFRDTMDGSLITNFRIDDVSVR